MDATLAALLTADPPWLATFEVDAYAADWARATASRCDAEVEESPVPPSPLSWFTFGAQKKEQDFGVVVPADTGPGSKLRVRAPSTGKKLL